jgi:hypothetical protein
MHWKKFVSENLRFSPVIPSLIHTHKTQPYDVCDSPDQAAQYHVLTPVGGFYNPVLGWLKSNKLSYVVFTAA